MEKRKIAMPAANQPDIIATASLDGVYYARLRLGEQILRCASTSPDWQNLLPNQFPDAAALSELAEQGIWIAPEKPAPALAAMCCGLGSIWPGMGRELYANFPLARKAMDAIASLADWDILGLMDELSLEKISQARWQIPYLFMLEYAQWSQLHGLGLRPTLICGHSLGELIALCLADVYSLASAWHLLETRAEHMAELEAHSRRQGGMLAVPAPYQEIAQVLTQWPMLRISNRNTYKQYILSGPSAQLLEARRMLRRKHIPAVMLNMDLAFHNPAMRILRDLSYRRLNGLSMRPAAFTMLSCIDAQEYPKEKPLICRRITDLDENTVDWVNLIEKITADHMCQTFLELGPQETLCGITSELSPASLCLAADKKGREAHAMAIACARLFSLGHLDFSTIQSLAKAEEKPQHPIQFTTPPPQDVDTSLIDIPEKDREIIFSLVAEACHKKPEEIRPEQDLRQDLAIRSASFPFLMMEAEARLGHPVILENLFQLATVADLARFLTGKAGQKQSTPNKKIRPEFALARRPLQRLRLIWQDQSLTFCPAPIEPLWPEKPWLAAIFDSELTDHVEEMPHLPWDAISTNDWEAIEAKAKAAEGIIFALAPRTITDCAPPLKDEDKEFLLKMAAAGCRIIIAQRFLINIDQWQPHLQKWLQELANILPEKNYRPIAWLDDLREPASGNLQEPLRMLSREPGQEEKDAIVWLPSGEQAINFGNYRAATDLFEDIWPDPRPKLEADASLFQGSCQYSLFRRPELQEHGPEALFSPLAQANPPESFLETPWLPLSAILAAMAKTAAIMEPTLKLIGLADLRIFRFLAMPSGITRECKIYGRNRLSLPQDGVPATLCRINMDAAALTANGRENGEWQPLCDGALTLASQTAPFEPLWDSCPEPEGDPVNLKPFYKCLNFGPTWQLLENFQPLKWQNGASGFSCDLNIKSGFASGLPISGFFDALLQAGMAGIGINSGDLGQIAASLALWRFSALGFGRFALVQPQDELSGAKLFMQHSWQDENIRRYEAQVLTKSGKLLLAVHNIEFSSQIGL